jgi:hypothetical protein
MMKEETLTLVSDGGAKTDMVSFGWVLGNRHGDQYVEGYGIARGTPMASFRAEAYARLSFIRFIIRYTEFLGVEVHAKFQILTYSDAKGMLQREEKLINAGYKSSSWYLASDQDVTAALEDSHRQMPIYIKTEHVKGHQDKDKAFEQLTLPEKFNVFADNIATYAPDLAITSKAEPDPWLPLPRGSPYLIHEGKMQTSHECTLLHSSYAGSQLKKYQLTKHNWTEKQHESVDWAANEIAMKRVDKRQHVFIVKLTYNCIPVHRWLYRQGYDNQAVHAMRGRRGGLRTSIPMHKARAMAHGFLDRVGGPFNETRDGCGPEDCNRYKRSAMAERRSTRGELPGRGRYMARVSQGIYLPQLEQAARNILPHARKGSNTRHRRTVDGSIDWIHMATDSSVVEQTE